jgi:biotin-dependent carboxylase-like uncharacterized protein
MPILRVAVLRVERVGLTTVQDLGRLGWAHLGVSPSGAADQSAYQLANRLVGNAPTSAVLETSGGLILTALSECVVVITGSECVAVADGVVLDHCRPILLNAGYSLRVDRMIGGVRSYVGFGGGIIGSPVLGSLAHDTLGGIVPIPLQEGCVLSLGQHEHTIIGSDIPIAPRARLDLRVSAGPHHTLFSEDVLTTITQSTWRVSPDASRIGIRLTGGFPSISVTGGLASIPLVRGAIQITPDAELIVMVADHPTTGGYPVPAVMREHDVDDLAQRPSGAQVRLVVDRRSY